MLRQGDEGPVYYREIQKNAFLKRIPPDNGAGGKLRPLGSKKPPLKAMWTLFCVHNGRTPYLEQYPEPDAVSTRLHKPTWRANLRTARHVTASVKPWPGNEFDFLVTTDDGPVRMLAHDWDSMQDWVTTLRNKLHELKVLSKGENVYCPSPAPPPVCRATRDPTSPLPPTPVGPPVRVPGIELVSQHNNSTNEANGNNPTIPPDPEDVSTSTNNTSSPVESQTETAESTGPLESLDRMTWDQALQLSAVPSTSQNETAEPKSVAKICGQNICLDDSVLKRSSDAANDSEEFFSEIDRLSDVMSLDVENSNEDERYGEFKQRMVVCGGENSVEEGGSCAAVNEKNNQNGEYSGANITVIQVSNKGPPHTAIPVLGDETQVFKFDFKQQVSVNEERKTVDEDFVNIFNTEVNIDHKNENYGTVFSNTESPYGHISLTTTVNLTGASDTVYERLCMASTSRAAQKQSVNGHRLEERRKSSLPNLNISCSDSTYEYLFPAQNDTVSNLNYVQLSNSNSVQLSNSNAAQLSNLNSVLLSNLNSVLLSNSNTAHLSNSNTTQLSNSNTAQLSNSNTSQLSNLNSAQMSNLNSVLLSNSNTAQLSNSNTAQLSNSNTAQLSNSNTAQLSNLNSVQLSNSNSSAYRTNSNHARNLNGIPDCNSGSTHDSNPESYVNAVSVNAPGTVTADVTNGSRVERSHSQSSYDSRRLRERLLRSRHQNHSPKRSKNEPKPVEAQQKPMWRRGLTELSLLSRLRGITQRNDRDVPPQAEPGSERVAGPVLKVNQRSRDTARADGSRRRSSSLSSGDPEPATVTRLQSLRMRQAATLRAEQTRGAAVVARVPKSDPPIFTDASGTVWIARWGGSGSLCGGRTGDRVAAVRGVQPSDSAHAATLLRSARSYTVDILFHRVPHGKIYVLNKKTENQSIGIKLDNECQIVSVESQSPAHAAGIPPPGVRWCITEVNNRQLNLVKSSEEEMTRLASCGTEVSILIQPAPLVKKLRAAVKGSKSLLGIR